MTHWLTSPGKAWKKRRDRKKAEREEERKTHIDGGILFGYPTDKFFTRPIKKPFLVIPKGYLGVRQRFGQIGEVIEPIKDPHGNEFNDEGDRVKNYRAIPYGGLVEPGFHFMVSLGGLLSRMAVVDARLRTESLELTNVVVEGFTFQLPKVVATLNYAVIDPVRAMTGAEDYRKTTHEMAKVRIRDILASNTLEKIAELKGRHNDLSPTPEENQAKQLAKAGVQIQGLYITDFDIPNELEKLLAAATLARRNAEAQVETAGAYKRAASIDAQTGGIYAGNPGAEEVLRMRTAQGSNGVGYSPHISVLGRFISEGLGKIADALRGKTH